MDQMREELRVVQDDIRYIRRYNHLGVSSGSIKRILTSQIVDGGSFHPSVQGALVEVGWDEELQEFHDLPDWRSLNLKLDRMLATMETSLKSAEMLECTESMDGSGSEAEVINIYHFASKV